MANLKDTKEDIFQQKVVLAARKLFQKHGQQKVTMEDVAHAVGKAKSSLYYYYKSKEDIWRAVMDIEMNELHTGIIQAVEKTGSVEKKIRAFCITKLTILGKKRALYNITLMPAGEGDEKVTYSIRRKYLKRESEILSGILDYGIDKGELRKLSKKDREVLIFVLLSGLHGLGKEMDIEKDRKLEQSINTLSHMIVYGLKV